LRESINDFNNNNDDFTFLLNENNYYIQLLTSHSNIVLFQS
jgi:hypothetical protein